MFKLRHLALARSPRAPAAGRSLHLSAPVLSRASRRQRRRARGAGDVAVPHDVRIGKAAALRSLEQDGRTPWAARGEAPSPATAREEAGAHADGVSALAGPSAHKARPVQLHVSEAQRTDIAFSSVEVSQAGRGGADEAGRAAMAGGASVPSGAGKSHGKGKGKVINHGDNVAAVAERPGNNGPGSGPATTSPADDLDPFDLDPDNEAVAEPAPSGRDVPPHFDQFGADEVEEILRADPPARDKWDAACGPAESGSLVAADVPIVGVPPMREAKVATLSRGLQRVLFNPGVMHLRDPRSGVWNFATSLADIPKPEEFAFHRTPQYITASKDEELAAMADKYQMRFIGSTSTLTQALSQIYFAMSGGRGVDLSTLSQDFAEESKDFTAGAQLPACLIVRRLPSGAYAIDNDKRHSVDENVLSDYGRILEKMLTAEKADFARFLMSSPEDAVPQAEREEREAYRYSHSRSILMRSQLDCVDARLPGSGVFDIKTRACFPIRHDRANYEENKAYALHKTYGMLDSFEREYYDLCRSGMLKYSLQARIGDMDGIFVAYHNTATCFGFQYLPLSELDQRLFGSTELADQAFHLSVGVLEALLERATALYPAQTLDLIVLRPRGKDCVVAYVRPHAYDKTRVRPIRAIVVKFASEVDGAKVTGPVELAKDDDERKSQTWKITYSLAITTDDLAGTEAAERGWKDAVALMTKMQPLNVPAGKSVGEMRGLDARERRAADEAAKRLAERQRGASRAVDAWERGEVVGAGAASAVSRPAEEQAEGEGSEVNTRPDVVDSADNAADAEAEADVVDESFARTVWREPHERIRAIRTEAKASGERYARVQATWKPTAAASQAGQSSPDA
ncbi:hypothetical protein Q5752_004422 [Cryptotrichosporon argae]